MSKQCMKPELDIFARRPIQTNVLRREEVPLKPLSALHQNSQIEFLSLSHANTYRDLNSVYLRLRVRLMKDALLSTPHTDGKVSVVNNIIHSLFRQVTVYLNNKIVYQGDNYHYRAYMENLYNFSPETATIHLESSGWEIDSGDFNAVKDDDNPGFAARAKQFAKSVEVELCSKLHCDLFNQPVYLLNGVDLRVILSLEKPQFYMMAPDDDKSSIEILDATLFIDHMTIAPEILLAHETVLQEMNAVYNYNHVEVKSFTVGPGSQTMTIDNVCIGKLPKMLICSFVDNQAYSGKRTKNPFNFENFNISQFHLIVNGRQIPTQSLTFDYSNGDAPISSRGYDLLFRETKLDRSHQITKSSYDKSMFMISLDLTADHSYNEDDYMNIASQGTITIEARFAKALDKTITVLVYQEFDATLEIDKERTVYTSY